jgi:hypothetical protein
MSARSIPNKNILRVAFITAFLLLVPFVAMQYSEDVVWTTGDFVTAGVLLFGAGITFELLAASRRGDRTYRIAAASAVGTGLFLIWANLAVGLIGNENNPANLMYLPVLAVAGIGGLLARFRPAGMARAMVATAVAQMLVAVIAQIAGQGSTYGVNGFFAVLWSAAALLFHFAAQTGTTEARA